MVLTVDFTLLGSRVQGLNGGDDFQFSEAVSFVVECDDQAEVDRLWEALTADGGEPGPCGWLKDRFGLSWQIAPRELNELMDDLDPERARRAMEDARAAGKIAYDELAVDTDVAKVSVVGIGMRSHAGVAARMFRALADENVNIKVISTSEIKISVLIDRKYMELAVQALHDAFELEKA